jgi:hypothetical protein
VHEDGLIFGSGPRQSVGVEHLPCHGGVGMSAHVGAVALAGPVLQLREGSVPGTGSIVCGVMRLLLPLPELCPHHHDDLCLTIEAAMRGDSTKVRYVAVGRCVCTHVQHNTQAQRQIPKCACDLGRVGAWPATSALWVRGSRGFVNDGREGFVGPEMLDARPVEGSDRPGSHISTEGTGMPPDVTVRRQPEACSSGVRVHDGTSTHFNLEK